MSTRSPAECTRPSVTRKPAASSRSSPGVRMTTAMLWSSTRISNGSSAARKSLSSPPAEPFIRRIATSRTRRPGKEGLFTKHHGAVYACTKIYPLARHYHELLLGNRVERRLVNAQVRHDKFRWSVGQPFGQRKVLVDAAFEHFQKHQVGVARIL